MNSILNKIAAALALIIGAMAVFAGGQVLLGKVPDYHVINWLPVYNFAMGILTVFTIAILIWKNSVHAMPAAIAAFAMHAAVMIILTTVYRDVVAIDSIVAMTIRLVVWLAILVLMFFHSRKGKTTGIKEVHHVG